MANIPYGFMAEGEPPMTSRDLLEGILQTLPEHRLEEVLDFAKFLEYSGGPRGLAGVRSQAVRPCFRRR